MVVDKVQKAKKVVSVIAISMIVVIGLAIYFFAIPAVKKVYTIKDEFEEKKLHYENLRNDAANAESYADLLVNINDNKDLLENALIKKGAEVSFIEKLEGVAQEVGNEIEIEHRKATPKKIKRSPEDQSAEAIAEAKKQEKNEASRVLLMVQVKGNYRTFLEFLYKLENMPYVFEIESIEISKGSRSGKLFLSEEQTPDYTEGNILISFIPSKK